MESIVGERGKGALGGLGGDGARSGTSGGLGEREGRLRRSSREMVVPGCV